MKTSQIRIFNPEPKPERSREAVGRRLCASGALITAVAAAIGVAYSGTAAAVQAGVWQNWGFPTDRAYETSEEIVIVKTAPTRFFTHQIWFKGGDAAYIGMVDRSPESPSKAIIFSLWNSPKAGTVGSPGSFCLPFSGEGVGGSCRIYYDWKVGRKYKLKIYETSTDINTGSKQWGGSITDTVTGVITRVGYLWNSPGQGQISGGTSWIENYGNNGAPADRCLTQQPAAAIFSTPILNSGTNVTKANSFYSETSLCGTHRSTIEPLAGGWFRLTE